MTPAPRLTLTLPTSLQTDAVEHATGVCVDDEYHLPSLVVVPHEPDRRMKQLGFPHVRVGGHRLNHVVLLVSPVRLELVNQSLRLIFRHFFAHVSIEHLDTLHFLRIEEGPPVQVELVVARLILSQRLQCHDGEVVVVVHLNRLPITLSARYSPTAHHRPEHHPCHKPASSPSVTPPSSAHRSPHDAREGRGRRYLSSGRGHIHGHDRAPRRHRYKPVGDHRQVQVLELGLLLYVPVQQPPVHHVMHNLQRVVLLQDGDGKHGVLLDALPSVVAQRDPAATVVTCYDHLSKPRRDRRSTVVNHGV